MNQNAQSRIAILISGRGSNMQSIVNACRNGRINAQVCCVFSNQPRAKGLDFARAHAIDTLTAHHHEFPERELFDRHMISALDTYRPDYIVLAGFMRILTPVFIDHYAKRILNIHPSLLPKYPGLHTHEKALEAGDHQHGASVHFVTLELDGGPVIIQSIVDVHADDDADKLANRVLAGEHVIYPLALEWILNQDITTNGKQCFYKGSAIVQPACWYNGCLTQPKVLQ